MTRRFALLAALGLLATGVVLVLAVVADDEEREDPLRTVFVGDSITRGVNPQSLEPDDTYAWVRYAVADDRSPWELSGTVAEFGMTLGQMAVGFEDQVLSQDPEGVVIMGGTNDALQQLPVDDSIEWLRSMVTSARNTGVEVWIIAPPPLDPSYGRDLQTLVDAQRQLAAEMDVPYVDVREELALPTGAWEPGLSSDGVHPSEEGARRIADLVLAAVGQ